MEVGPAGGCIPGSDVMGSMAVGNMTFESIKQLSVKFRKRQSPAFPPFTQELHSGKTVRVRRAINTLCLYGKQSESRLWSLEQDFTDAHAHLKSLQRLCSSSLCRAMLELVPVHQMQGEAPNLQQRDPPLLSKIPLGRPAPC